MSFLEERPRLGDSYWQAQNLVAAGRCWMIGIEILWIQSLGLQRVRILEAASQRRSGKLWLLMSLGRLLCFFLGLLVPVLISWHILAQETFSHVTDQLGVPWKVLVYPPICVAVLLLLSFQAMTIIIMVILSIFNHFFITFSSFSVSL